MKYYGELNLFSCLDSPELSESRRKELRISRDDASELGRSAVEAAAKGYYVNKAGQRVDWSGYVQAACTAKRSIPPRAPLPEHEGILFPETCIQVTNETTLGASLRLSETGFRPLALNFANGIQPGGGFLDGARAQEEVLCRSSALYQTLIGDSMYTAHSKRQRPDSTDWAIDSPNVPVFRMDGGTVLDQPWLLCFLTCAAPYAPEIGQLESGILLHRRIHRALAIARAYGHSALVLGAWGCGAFGNDPNLTAVDFRQVFETDFRGAFSEIVFAITDWSPERRSLGPFRDVFAPKDIR